MKKFQLFITVFALAFSMQAQQPSPLPASEVLKDAYTQAKKENKFVFVMFHASWCGWCHKMDKSMNDPACRDYFDKNFVIKHLVVDENKDKKDLENPGANELRNQYYGNEQGIPFWLIFDKDGKLISDSKIRKEGEGPEKGENVGCPASEKEVAYFIDVLKKTKRLKAPELEVIKARFRKNEL
jgi:thioredoxin-related protein